AEHDHPGPRWLVGDLAELDLPSRGISEPFDVIVSAGNVMAFLAPSTRRQVLRRLRSHLADPGRAVIGFGAGRDYEFSEFLSDADAAGLVPDLLLSTWDLRPFTDKSDFLVALLRRDDAPS
ncbi:CheR family methyltransferase, partial [Mycobacteroides abscessus subsp. massiliense]